MNTRFVWKRLLLLALLLVLRVPADAAPAGQPLLRTVLALYDSSEENLILPTPIHQLVEMPLNHLGLVVRYRDINRPLPPLQELGDVRGILTWFESNAMADPQGFISWAEAAIDARKKFVVLGTFGVSQDLQKRTTPSSAVDHFLAKLGLRSEGGWNFVTYDMKIAYKDPSMVEFERRLDGVLPTFEGIKNIDSHAKSYLILRRGSNPDLDNHLVVIGPNGGYVAGGYTHYSNAASERLEWYLNPFEFFRLAFGTDDLPKPDATTLSGRRTFYSQVDGDGWRNSTEISSYRNSRNMAAGVILNEVIQVFPDLPVTVAPIAADLDPKWAGTTESLRVAKRFFALPNVEAGSHTYSHPLDWGYFAHPASNTSGGGLLASLQKIFSRGNETDNDSYAQSTDASGKRRYESPRSFSAHPFNLKEEIEGSIAFINTLLPPGKKVEVLQWSGNSMPFEAAVAATRAAGIRNINGGDTRFDLQYHSYAWVAPLGRQLGAQRQIFASTSNENTYTNLWTDSFFGFKNLVQTLRNTESPRRIKPLNVYYHMYSGQKLSSLNAVLDNLNYARTQEIIPVTTSHYAAIADGFYTTRIIPLGEHRWQIENRGALETIRFDRAASLTVDFARSHGVIGERRYQDSLYVALDEADAAPVIALQDRQPAGQMPQAEQPYLVQSRCPVWAVRQEAGLFRFSAQGFGRCDMVWKVPGAGRFGVRVLHGKTVRKELQPEAGKDGLLSFEVGPSPLDPLEVTVRRLQGLP